MAKTDTTPYVFSAQEADTLIMHQAESRKKLKATTIGWGENFPTLKAYGAPPIFAGQTWVIQGCPGEGKSLFGSWFAQHCMRHILDNDQDKRIVLKAVLEEGVEIARARSMSYPIDFKLVASGDADLEGLRVNMMKSADDPIYYIGPSMAGEIIHPDAAAFKGLTPREIGLAAYGLKTEYKLELAAFICDYIQLMTDNERSSKRYEQITNASTELLQLGISVLRCPVLVLAQSKLSEVKDRQDKIPGLKDIQHSSQISQDADVVWSTWYPANDYPLYSTLKIDSVQVPVLRDMLVVKILKWRGCGSKISNRIMMVCMGKPFGELFEVSLSDLSKIDVGFLRSRGIENYVDILEA